MIVSGANELIQAGLERLKKASHTTSRGAKKSKGERYIMKDERGLYYHPFPQNKNVRMYVCENEGDIFFRLWSADETELWEQHGWIPYDAIKQAAGMYEKKNDFDPERAYDLEIAKALLRKGK